MEIRTFPATSGKASPSIRPSRLTSPLERIACTRPRAWSIRLGGWKRRRPGRSKGAPGT